MVESRQLTQADHHTRALDRAAQEILRVWPRALEDADARGYPPGRGYDTAGGGNGGITVALPDGSVESVPATAVERLVLSGDRSIESRAVAWLAELGDVLIQLGTPWPRRYGDGPLRAAIREVAERFPAGQPLARRIFRLADEGSAWWPKPPKRGQTVAGVTIGARGSDAGTCAYCGEPTISSNGPRGRRWIQDPKTGERLEFHKSPCWYRYSVNRNRPA